MIELAEKVCGERAVRRDAPVNFTEAFDVVVAGLGTAGAIAAIAAARRGLRVLGVERLGAPGGTMTMTGIGGYYFGNPGGIFEEIDAEVRKRADLAVGGAFPNPDLRKYVLDRALEESGAAARYESTVTGVYFEGRRIVGVRIFSAGRETDVAARALIDATGDGDVCDLAGCRTDFGRRSDAGTVPFTILRSALRGGERTETNPDSGIADQRDVRAFSREIVRAQGVFARTPGGERTLRLSALPGIREGRRLDGEEKVRLPDLLDGRRTDKPIAYAYADLDKHGADVAFESDLFRKWHVLSNLGALNITAPIPMGALIAREYDNLLAAGRCLSVDHETATCVRMCRDMQKLGEAAAVIASVALRDGVPFRAADYGKVSAALRGTGCLDEANDRGFWFDGHQSAPCEVRRAEFLSDPDEICAQLATRTPGVAIWSCRSLGAALRPRLIENLSAADGLLRVHSALALAVADDPAGAEVLRETVAARDRTALLDVRKNNKTHLAMALCALGILRDEGSADVIADFIADEREPACDPGPGGFRKDYYVALSCAVAALLDIARAHPARREEIGAFLEARFASPAYIRTITLRPEGSPEHALAAGISAHVRAWRAEE